MDIPSERRIEPRDYHLIRTKLVEAKAALQATGSKGWITLVDIDLVMDHLYETAFSWIVDGYLVAYELGIPWYSDHLLLNELIVCRLSGRSAFGAVPSFLERKAREAGCSLMTVGTALARHDEALASLYIKEGFNLEAYSLTKDI